MDGIVFKAREGSKVINKTIFLTLGPQLDIPEQTEHPIPV